jgi:hypothetical protein
MKKMIWFVLMFSFWFNPVRIFAQPIRPLAVPEGVRNNVPASFQKSGFRFNTNAGKLVTARSTTRTIYEYHAFSLEPDESGMVFVGYGAAAGELSSVRMKIVEQDRVFSRARLRPQLSYKGGKRQAEMSTYQQPLRAITRAGQYTFSATWLYQDGREERFVFEDTEVGPMVVWWDGCRHEDGSVELLMIPLFLDKEPDQDRIRIETAPLVDGRPGEYVISKEPDAVRPNIDGLFWFLQVPFSAEEYQKLYDIGTVSFRICDDAKLDGVWAPRLDIGLPRLEVFDYCG